MPEEENAASSDEPDEKSPNFWVTLPGILTAVAGVITAITGLLVVLGQTGVIGGDDPTEPSALIANDLPDGGTGDEGDDESESHPLTGRWRGQVYGASSGFESALELEVKAACAMREPCGSQRLLRPLCEGYVELWSVDATTYEFNVTGFSPESSNKCTPGAGDFYTLLDDDTLRYHTNYDDVTGTLIRID